MIGLALSGGGVKGSYELGAYLALKKCHIKIDGITGTSIGAINGAMICAGLEKELFNFWKNAEIGKVLGFDKEYVDNYNFVHSLRFYKFKFKNFYKIVKNKGIDTSGLESLLQNYDLEKKIRQSKKDFGITTYRVKDHKPLNIFVSEMSDGSLNNYILSSCFLPIFKKKKLENDSYYMDGGFTNYMPCNMLLEKGYDHVYAIDLKAPGITKKIIDKNKVTIIRPSSKLSGMLSLDKKQIYNNMLLGYYDTLKTIKSYDGIKYIFTKKKAKYYDKLLSKFTKDDITFWKMYYHAKNNQELVIKIIEKEMKRQNKSYFKVYHLTKLIWQFHFQKNDDINQKLIKKLKLWSF